MCPTTYIKYPMLESGTLVMEPTSFFIQLGHVIVPLKWAPIEVLANWARAS